MYEFTLIQIKMGEGKDFLIRMPTNKYRRKDGTRKSTIWQTS